MLPPKKMLCKAEFVFCAVYLFRLLQPAVLAHSTIAKPAYQENLTIVHSCDFGVCLVRDHRFSERAMLA